MNVLLSSQAKQNQGLINFAGINNPTASPFKILKDFPAMLRGSGEVCDN